MFILEYRSISVKLISNVTKFELHYVSGKCAGFVGEYVTYLPKFLIQRGRGYLCRPIPLLTVHQPVILYKVCLHYLNHLDRHDQGDRDQSVQEKEVAEEGLSERGTEGVHQTQIGIVRRFISVPVDSHKRD